jgi:hypothetical protein
MGGWILGRLAGDLDWIRLAHDRDRWMAVVNAVMSLQSFAPRIKLFRSVLFSLR